MSATLIHPRASEFRVEALRRKIMAAYTKELDLAFTRWEERDAMRRTAARLRRLKTSIVRDYDGSKPVIPYEAWRVIRDRIAN
jgi:hypothetical protein